jgi:hypothetical protein
MEYARGDWWRLVADAAALSEDAVELSALSWSELPSLVDFCSVTGGLPFEYISVHGPTKALGGSDHELALMLLQLPEWIDAIVLHPDVMTHAPAFRALGNRVLLENMDARKGVGTSVGDIEKFFVALPDAGFCLDVAHAGSVDPTMRLGHALLDAFSSRLREVHLSSLDAQGKHVPMTQGDYSRFRPLLDRCSDVPWIFEAPVEPW